MALEIGLFLTAPAPPASPECLGARVSPAVLRDRRAEPQLRGCSGCPGRWHGAEGVRRARIPRRNFGETAASPASSSGEHTGRGILWGQLLVLLCPATLGPRRNLERASDGERAAEGTGCPWVCAWWGPQCMGETQLALLTGAA